MATSIIKQIMNNSGTRYCKMPDGTLLAWGAQSIDVTTGTKDRVLLDFPSEAVFIGTPSIHFTVVENGYNVQPILLLWDTSGGYYALNKASVPNKHIIFRWSAVGRWK